MAHAEIHEFTAENTTVFDDDGDPLFGFFYVIFNDHDEPQAMLGPYSSAIEAELASQTAWEKGDY